MPALILASSSPRRQQLLSEAGYHFQVVPSDFDEDSLGMGFSPGDLAERYGYVNRSFPDTDLDAFVESLASRIASFDKQAIRETKRFVDVASLPPDFEIAPEWNVCLASIMRPAAQERIKKLMDQGFHKTGDVENRLGYHVGQLGR